MVRPTDQEMIVIKKRVCHSSQKEQVFHIMQATQGDDRFGQVAEEVRGACGQEPLLLFHYCFSGKEWSRQGKQG